MSFDGKTLTYDELNARANQMARYLKKRGVKKGEYVGISLERSFDLIIGMLGIIKAGAVYVPIDQSYPMERKLFMIQDAELKILLTQSSFIKQFPKEHIYHLFLRYGNMNLHLDFSQI